MLQDSQADSSSGVPATSFHEGLTQEGQPGIAGDAKNTNQMAPVCDHDRAGLVAYRNDATGTVLPKASRHRLDLRLDSVCDHDRTGLEQSGLVSCTARWGPVRYPAGGARLPRRA
jgi:hypothetical protein